MPEPAAAPPPGACAVVERPAWARRIWPRGFAATMRPRIRWSAAVALAVMAFGAWWPDDLDRDQAWFVRCSWAAFMIRTFWFHAGVALLADAALALALRARFTAAVLAVVGAAAAWPGAATFIPRGGAPAPGQPTLTILSANLLFGRADPVALRRVIDSVNPDVMVFQEYTPASADALRDVAARFPHRAESPRGDAFGQAVYSRLPFAAPPRLFPNGPGWSDPQIRVEVEFDGGRVAIMNVHLQPPSTFESFREQRRQTAALARLTTDEIARLAPAGAFVLAGDLNAVPGSSHLSALLDAGLREAHAESGFGRGSTWPRGSILAIPPGVRIDHVLMSSGLRCVQSGAGADIDSDHRPTFARFVRRR